MSAKKNNARVELGQRIKQAREAKGISQAKLGSVAVPNPITAQSVLKWEQGRSAPNSRTLDAIAQLTGVSLKWLLYGVEERTEAGQSGEQSHVGRVVDMVDYTSVSRYLDGEKDVSKGKVRTNFPCSARSFQTYANDDANYPVIREGASIVIDQERKPRNGKLCMVLLDGEPFIGRYRPKQGRIVVAPINEADWPDAVEVSEDDLVGAVTEITHPHG